MQTELKRNICEAEVIGEDYPDKTCAPGMVFGRLTVLCLAPNNDSHGKKWICLCECGNQCSVRNHSLYSGHTKSCGCLHKDAMALNSTHKMAKSKPYKIWANMKVRCLNKNTPYYVYYGGRGITVCDEWLTFENFWADMKEGYEEGLTLDRKDPELGYFKENCRWADHAMQSHNRRKRDGCSSSYLGVCWDTAKNKWTATISFEGATRNLGRFVDEYSAAIAHDDASEELYGDRPNGTLSNHDSKESEAAIDE